MSESTLELDALCLEMADTIELQLEAQEPPSEPERIANNLVGAVVGKLTGFGETGEPLVEAPGTSEGRLLAARATISLLDKDIGRDVVLVFDRQDWDRPVVIGLIQPPVRRPCQMPQSSTGDKVGDGTLTLSAEHEITLTCGQASITLTKAGKVIIRGTYVISRSSGVNSIKGGSVQIN
jgi:hypothetical protein